MGLGEAFTLSANAERERMYAGLQLRSATKRGTASAS